MSRRLVSWANVSGRTVSLPRSKTSGAAWPRVLGSTGVLQSGNAGGSAPAGRATVVVAETLPVGAISRFVHFRRWARSSSANEGLAVNPPASRVRSRSAR